MPSLGYVIHLPFLLILTHLGSSAQFFKIRQVCVYPFILNIMNVCRTITFSEETDRALRAYLDQQGMQEGDISKFIEAAVTENLVKCILGKEGVNSEKARALLEKAVEQMDKDGFEATVARIKIRTTDLSEDEVMNLVDEALEHAH